MKKVIYFLTSILTVISVMSCSNEDNTKDNNFDNRSLIKSVSYTFTDSEGIFTNFLSYDTSGNLQSLTSNNVSENYSWSPNSIEAEYQVSYGNNDFSRTTESFVRNSNGYVTSGEITFESYYAITESTRSRTQHYNCVYNGSDQLTQIITSATDDNGNLITEQTDFTWENGNIILINKSNQLYELEYYADLKETRDVGLRYLSVNSVYYSDLWGYFSLNWYSSLRGGLYYANNPMFLSKNLLKKYFDGTTTIEYFYDFDSKGRVIRQSHISSESYLENIVILYEYFD
jgi:hypothetical protein